jgi:hypothetical protein
MADLIEAASTNAMGAASLDFRISELSSHVLNAMIDRDIGLFAAWSVSSSKPGFEVEQLTDPSTSTFWQYVAFAHTLVMVY